MRQGILVDTCSLVDFVNPGAERNAITTEYIDQAIRDSVPLYLSSLTVAEFCCKQDIGEIDVSPFIISPFDQPEAELSGRLDFEVHRDSDADKVRHRVDTMLIAHAEKLRVAGILTGDASSLAKYCDRARAKNLVDLHVVLTTEAFEPSRMKLPGAGTLQLQDSD